MNGFVEQQVCSVYLPSDCTTIAGVNAGEAVCSAADSFVGDVYLFSPRAEAYQLLLPDQSARGPVLSYELYHERKFGPEGLASREIGRLGQGLRLDSRLCFMGSNGSQVEALVVSNLNPDPGRGAAFASREYLLPLMPLRAGLEYTLIRAEDDPGTLRHHSDCYGSFGRGTLIRMADGSARAVEKIEVGALLATRDNGAQPVRWIGARAAPAFGPMAPVLISRDALGNSADLLVSPSFRVLMSDWRAEVMLGSREVLVAAADLVNDATIFYRQGGMVEYYQFLLDRQEIIYAEDTAAVSMQISAASLAAMAEDSRAEIIELFPDAAERHTPASLHKFLRSGEASEFLKQVGHR